MTAATTLIHTFMQVNAGCGTGCGTATAVGAATTQDPGIWPLARLALFVLAVAIPGYVIACVIWPLAACRKCKGDGKFRTSSGRAWRRCRRCGGSGARIRIGKRIYNYLRKLEKDAS